VLDIVYQDADYVAINKPAGLLVHRSNIDRQESRFAVQMLRDQIGQRVHPVHRLDKPTSGVLLFALHTAAARAVGEGFLEQAVQKTYLAIVRGRMLGEGTIEHALKPKHDAYAGNPVAPSIAQAASTDYRSLATAEIPIPVGPYATARYSLVQLQPITGRKHQLRRHLKHVFHPIVGDTTHGDGKNNRLFRQHFACHRLLLVALELRMIQPLSGESLHIRAEPGVEFKKIVKLLGWSNVKI